MAPQIEHAPIRETERIRQVLLARLMAALQDVKGTEVLVRAEVLVEGIDALQWLAVQPPMARGYWADRENEFELAGIGRADLIDGDHAADYDRLMNELHSRIDAARGSIRYFGGLRFAEAGPHDPEWNAFKQFRFVLPRFELVRKSGITTLACNMRADDDMESVALELEALRMPDSPALPVAPPAPLGRTDVPDRELWMQRVEDALASVREDRYEKIVLARRASLNFSEAIESGWLLSRLQAETTNAFLFCFQPDARHAFLGASPERLYRRDERRLRTEAIAGTRPRGATEKDDEDLGQDLLSDEKELREHRYVVDGITAALDPFVQDLAVDANPSLLKLTHAQHLISRFRAVLRDGVSDGDLLRALHPTPAVGGYPRAAAVADIPVLEGFDRGYFAAPVGWVEKNAAQFAVGIRSGLVEDCSLHLFSGAGIVEGSVPAQEWEEIENKIEDFLGILPKS